MKRELEIVDRDQKGAKMEETIWERGTNLCDISWLSLKNGKIPLWGCSCFNSLFCLGVFKSNFP